MPKVRDMMQCVEDAVNSYMRSTKMSTSFYVGHRTRPSQFLQNTVRRFEDELAAYSKWIDENEQLILMDTGEPSSTSSLQKIPTMLKNSHEFFIDLAARVRCLAHTEFMFVSHSQVPAKI